MHRALKSRFAFASGCLVIATLVAIPIAQRDSGPDGVLSRGFGDSLAGTETSWSETRPNVWLSSLGAPAAPIAQALRPGDVITIGGHNGLPQSIEVTALEHVDGRAIGLSDVRLQLVTGRAAGHAAGPVVRFLFAVDAPARNAVPGPTADRVL